MYACILLILHLSSFNMRSMGQTCYFFPLPHTCTNMINIPMSCNSLLSSPHILQLPLRLYSPTTLIHAPTVLWMVRSLKPQGCLNFTLTISSTLEIPRLARLLCQLPLNILHLWHLNLVVNRKVSPFAFQYCGCELSNNPEWSRRPTIIAPDVDMQVVTNRIAFGKFYNAGQVSEKTQKKIVCVCIFVFDMPSSIRYALHPTMYLFNVNKSLHLYKLSARQLTTFTAVTLRATKGMPALSLNAIGIA